VDGQKARSQASKVAFWIMAVFYSIMSLVSLFGFIGCLSRKRAFVSLYSGVSWGLFGVSVLSGIVSLIQLYRSPLPKCPPGANTLNGATCTAASTVSTDVVITIIQIAFWLIQFCA
jgi:hypothetical protein